MNLYPEIFMDEVYVMYGVRSEIMCENEVNMGIDKSRLAD